IVISPDGNSSVSEDFAPLQITNIPDIKEGNWQPLVDALPDFTVQTQQAPRPIEIDVNARQVRLFLPGFDKKQVKLTQYGPEVTIEAGDQRRNILLPPALSGKPVAGAKFQNQYLIISF
ncbi:MAG: ArsA family ATPase, partial [Rivularia sp. (in: cyanobacteria)]